MSEHELWNELGNLYFLSGTYKQAVHAYKKSIQLESSFGKPLSNLALIYTKQAKYEDAIQLYKKSLDLLTDDIEKAITWTRLGNVYRQLKNYHEAVVAYQCADDLRTNKVKFAEQSNQMPYVSTESEYLLYEIVEEQRYQNHFDDYMMGAEPEFDEALPEFALVEVEMVAKEHQFNQNTFKGRDNESKSESVSMLPVGEVKIPEAILIEDGPSMQIEKTEEEETSLDEFDITDVDKSREQGLSGKIFTKEVTQKTDSITSTETDAALKEASTRVISGQGVPPILEAGNRPKENALEIAPAFSEHIAQSEDIVEPITDDSTSVLLESDDCLNTNTSARDDRLMEPAISAEEDVEKHPEELRSTTEETDSHSDLEQSEAKAWLEETKNQIDHETDKSADDKFGEVSSTILGADNRPKEDAPEIAPARSEHIAQSEDIVEATPDDATSDLSESDDYLNTDTPARDDRLIVPAFLVEEDAEYHLNEFGSTTIETNSHSDIEFPEENAEVVEFVNLVEYEPDKNEEYTPDYVENTPSIDTISHTIKGESQGIERGISVEERKLTKQIEINPRNATTWEALGTLYKTAGRYEEAVQAFEQAVSIAPKTVSYYHNIGLVYSVSGNNEGAFNAFQKVLELDPNHSLTHASLGRYYKKIGLEELAQHHIGKAMKYIYESENEYNRACLEAICGNSTQAIDLLRTALEKKQTYVDWVLHDPDLDSLRDDESFKQLISDFSK